MLGMADHAMQHLQHTWQQDKARQHEQYGHANAKEMVCNGPQSLRVVVCKPDALRFPCPAYAVQIWLNADEQLDDSDHCVHPATVA